MSPSSPHVTAPRRGLPAAQLEWKLIAATQNMLKLPRIHPSS